MSEITKLYENAGILKECLSPCYINKTGRKTHDCPNCDNRENYPPFTAEKQIELIKLIANSKGYPDYEYFGKLFDDYIQLLEFDEALAQLVNSIWQDLTEEEKGAIRGILRT